MKKRAEKWKEKKNNMQSKNYARTTKKKKQKNHFPEQQAAIYTFITFPSQVYKRKYIGMSAWELAKNR